MSSLLMSFASEEFWSLMIEQATTGLLVPQAWPRSAFEGTKM